MSALVRNARGQFERGASWYRERVPEPAQRQVDRGTQNLARQAAGIAEQAVERTITLLTGGISSALAYIDVSFWSRPVRA